jgi:hypothetical protein
VAQFGGQLHIESHDNETTIKATSRFLEAKQGPAPRAPVIPD